MEFSSEILEKEYAKLTKQYKLPSFKALNEDFEIDKIERETNCLLRLIRKVMMEKIVNSINFLELLINPVNTPRIYLAYLRSMSQDDRKEIEHLYDALGMLSIQSLELEVDYIEKREADIIRQISQVWQELKPGFRKILKNMQHPNSNATVKKEKSYYG